MVVHTIWWLFRRKRSGGSLFLGESWQKVSEIPSQLTSSAWWHMSVIKATQEAYVDGFWSKASPGQKCKTLSKKITKAKINK
jgi:hypothetical protein